MDCLKQHEKPREPINRDNTSSAEYCFAVARRMSFTIRSDANLVGPNFW